MAGLRSVAIAPFRFARKAATVPHPGGGWGLSHSLLNNSRKDYARGVDVTLNTAAGACLNWIGRTFPEAPIVVREETDGETEIIADHPMTRLLRNPNPYYSIEIMLMATTTDWLVSGNAYWIKVRAEAGNILELRWIPQAMLTPKWPPSGDTFISHYELSTATGPLIVAVEDVVHFPYGIDPNNTRQGLSPLRSALREIWTDDEASNFTAALLGNMGVPGAVISPSDPGVVMDKDDREAVRQSFDQMFKGDRRGSVMVASSKTEVKTFGWTPEQLNLSAMRAIPEERITALLGIPAAVVGLGTGLEQTKVGATMRELREQAYESGIIPLQRLFASQLERQLLPEFDDTEGRSVGFDLRAVRVLQEDENAIHERLRADMLSGAITREEFRKATGHAVLPDDDVFLMPISIIEVARDGTLRREDQAAPLAVPATEVEEADGVAAGG